MGLIKCPACGREISTEAESCPQCGHPNRPTGAAAAGPKCYACAAPATTRCQSCGALSCATHLQSVYVSHGRGGAYELRCAPCYASAMESKALNMVIGICLIVVILIVILVIVLQSQRAKGPKKDTTQAPASIVVVDAAAEPAAAAGEAAFERANLRNNGGKTKIGPRAP